MGEARALKAYRLDRREPGVELNHTGLRGRLTEMTSRMLVLVKVSKSGVSVESVGNGREERKECQMKSDPCFGVDVSE